MVLNELWENPKENICPLKTCDLVTPLKQHMPLLFSWLSSSTFCTSERSWNYSITFCYCWFVLFWNKIKSGTIASEPVNPDDPFRHSFLEDSFWIGHPVFTGWFLKQGWKVVPGVKKTLTSLPWREFYCCRPATAPVSLRQRRRRECL